MLLPRRLVCAVVVVASAFGAADAGATDVVLKLRQPR
jgi:hypothetical protein